MDKALVFGTKDCRLESCEGQHSSTKCMASGCWLQISRSLAQIRVCLFKPVFCLRDGKAGREVIRRYRHKSWKRPFTKHVSHECVLSISVPATQQRSPLLCGLSSRRRVADKSRAAAAISPVLSTSISETRKLINKRLQANMGTWCSGITPA
jgi:hypothetical protein